MSKQGIAAGLACAFALTVAPPAFAHNGNVKYVDAAVSAPQHGRGVRLGVRVDATEVAAATGLGADLDTYELGKRGAVVSAWMLRGLEVESDGARCSSIADMPELVAGDSDMFVHVEAEFSCKDGGALTLVDTSLNTEDPGHRTIVSVGDSTTVLRAGDHRVALSAPPNLLATCQNFAWEGVIHLVTGYDHVLFLLSLLFAAGVVARRRGTRAAVKEIARVVTAFTVGHSVTLVLASLGVVSLNVRFVESVIAASIVAVAALNVFKPEQAVGRPWIALAFGLIHGFGFSSVLAEVGLPAGQTAAALLSFNLGIELAQLAIVAIAIAPLAWLATQERFYRVAVMRVGSLAIAALATVWFVERAFGF
jgi:hypothetical protein